MNTTEISESIRSILMVTTDYRVSLDAARQLQLAGPSFADLKIEAAERGSILADQAISKATTPSDILSILEYLSRKLYWDIHDIANVLTRWEKLTPIQKVEFLATGGSLWYEYLSIVFRSLVSAKREMDASALAAAILNTNLSTTEGYVIVGSEYARWLLEQNRITEAFKHFEWIAKEAPTHRKAALAHYWLSLRSLKRRSTSEAKHFAASITRCFAGSPSLAAEWELDCRAWLIISDLDPERLKNITKYDNNFIQREFQVLNQDIDSI